ncbi:methyl-accepting chemotaxis protein [Siculibacillus lacustris]|uniref:Methyl-accepting chemotaxis protein n=1 Tax=Siculibacillus lacustris TaxID=1549641 RepID=A0A4Q9VXQ3_9HYPH|nr:HAMP domain-containing methyl-accepting chemotaxis protein [Siculibacillus lacustris]TBW41272.1 methyl-accepting chemotaxis protein [Siculibacillus lacustris]
MRKSSRLGIGAIIGGLIAVLGGVLVMISGVQMLDRYTVWRSAQKVADVTALDKELFVALQAFRFERGDTNTGLTLPADKVVEATKAVQANRDSVDKALSSVLARSTIDVAQWAEARRALASGYEQVKGLRVTADANLAKPLEARDSAVLQTFGPKTLEFLSLIERAVDALESEVQRVDPIAGKLIFAKRMAWNARSAAGNGALTMMAAIGADRGFSADERRMMASHTAKVELFWSLLDDSLAATADGVALRAAIAKDGAGYFAGSYAERRARALEQLAAGPQSIFKLPEFQALTSASMRTLGETSNTLMNAAIETAGAADGRARFALFVNACAMIFAMVLAIGGFFIVRNRVVRPIRAMTDCMARLAGDDTTVSVPCIDRRDEIGDMAAAVEIFKTGLIRNKSLESEAVASRERGETERKRALQDLAAMFERSVGAIVDHVAVTAHSLEGAARVLSTSAEKSANQSGAVAAAAEEAGSNVANVASAAEEMGASINEIVRRVEQAAVMTRGVVTQSSETSCLVRDLSAATGRIGDILGMISTIAGQTNLLALNATIEAARAGEAGKGFAVVAGEVKNLANLTAKATADISQQISAIQESTQKASSAMSTISGAIDGVNQMTAAISTAAEQQGSATQQIVGSIHEASVGTREVTANISGVAAAIAETGDAAAQVLTSSTDLAQMASKLKKEVDGFLGGIRAA